MLANVVYDLKQKITIPCYTTGKIGECYTAIAENLPKILEFKLNKQSHFICGDSLTWLDFFFFEIVLFMEFLHPNLLKDFPYLKNYKQRMNDLPNIKEYFFNPRTCIDLKYQFNNKVAKINNEVRKQSKNLREVVEEQNNEG